MTKLHYDKNHDNALHVWTSRPNNDENGGTKHEWEEHIVLDMITKRKW